MSHQNISDMRVWFLAKVKYAKENEQGLFKDVTEQYLVDAVSFTECEAIIHKKVGEYIRGAFQIVSIARSSFVETFFYEDSEVWWKCKMKYLIADINSGKEKIVTQLHLVTAEDAKQAYDRIQESMSNMMVYFTIQEVVKTEILDVFPYENKKFENDTKVTATLSHKNAEGEIEKHDITNLLNL